MVKKLDLKTKIAVAILFPGFLIAIAGIFVLAVVIYSTAFILKISGILDALDFLLFQTSKKLKKYEHSVKIGR